MSHFTTDRRSLLKGGTALAAAGALTGPSALLDCAKAWAQTAQWKPEAGAKLNCCAGSASCSPRTIAFMKIVEAFTEGNRRDQSTCPRILRGRAAQGVGRGQHRRRASTWSGALFAAASCSRTKCIDVTDVADYLGKKYGGWVAVGEDLRQAGQQMDRHSRCRTAVCVNYRVAAAEEGRLQGIPERPRRLPRAVQGA